MLCEFNCGVGFEYWSAINAYRIHSSYTSVIESWMLCVLVSNTEISHLTYLRFNIEYYEYWSVINVYRIDSCKISLNANIPLIKSLLQITWLKASIYTVNNHLFTIFSYEETKLKGTVMQDNTNYLRCLDIASLHPNDRTEMTFYKDPVLKALK